MGIGMGRAGIPHSAGTIGGYLRDKSNSNNVCGITASHVWIGKRADPSVYPLSELRKPRFITSDLGGYRAKSSVPNGLAYSLAYTGLGNPKSY